MVETLFPMLLCDVLGIANWQTVIATDQKNKGKHKEKDKKFDPCCTVRFKKT